MFDTLTARKIYNSMVFWLFSFYTIFVEHIVCRILFNISPTCSTAAKV